MGGIAAADGLVIVGGRDVLDDGDLWLALAADTGEERWRFLYPAPGRLDYGNSPRATPLVADGVVFLFGAFGHLHALEAPTGHILWTKNLAQEFSIPKLDWGLTGSPLLVDGKLIVQPGGRSACLVAMDPKSGKVLWKTSGGKPGHASFIAASAPGGMQVIGYDADSLGGWSVADGKRLWKVTPRLSGDFNVPTPIRLDERRLFVCTENNGARIYAFTPQGSLRPEPTATCETLAPDSHTPVVSRGRVYGAANGLHCLDANNGLKEIWVNEDEAFQSYVSLIACDHRILAYTTAAELILLADEGETCREVSRLKLANAAKGVLSHPALVGSRLFVRMGRQIARLDLE